MLIECVHTSVQLCSPAHACVATIVFLHCSPPQGFFVFVFLRQDLSPNQEIASTVTLAILQAPRSSFSLPPSAGMTGASHGQLLCGC